MSKECDHIIGQPNNYYDGIKSWRISEMDERMEDTYFLFPYYYRYHYDKMFDDSPDSGFSKYAKCPECKEPLDWKSLRKLTYKGPIDKKN